MKEIQKQVVTWHRSVFENATVGAIESKLLEECRELIEAVHMGNYIDIVDEIADTIIVSCALLHRYGVDINEAVLAKLEVNRLRVWGETTKNGDRPRVK